MSASKRMRFEILKRDGFRCVYCGAEPAEAELHVDHVVPASRGGGDEPANLVTSCAPCNSGKSAIPLTDASRDVRTPSAVVAERARAAAEIAAGRVAHSVARDALAARFLAKWESALGRASGSFKASIPRLVDEWDPVDLDDAMARTERKGLADSVSQGRYFHGVLRAWRTQAEAKALTPEELAARRQTALDAARGEADPLKRANHRRAALRLGHDDDTLHRLGCDLFEARCYEESLDAFARVARASPGSTVAAGNAAIAAYNARQYVAARAWASLAPDRPQSQEVVALLAEADAKADAKAESERLRRAEWARLRALDRYEQCVASAELGGVRGIDDAVAAVLPQALTGRTEVRLADIEGTASLDLAWRATQEGDASVRRAALRKAMRRLGWSAGPRAVWRQEARA